MGEEIDPETAFGNTLVVAAKLPGVRIDRDAYLRRTFARYCTEDQVRNLIQESPTAAGVPDEVIESAARAAIRLETTRVTALSAAAGIPGGLTMLGAIPADTAQYFGHMIRISQKLAYLYGWPDLFVTDRDEMDDATKNVLILFIGAMLGANAANGAIRTVSQMVAQQVARKLPQQALTKGTLYPLVKKVAGQLGLEMTKRIFAGGVSKAVPVVGAVASGGITLATFLPMCNRLKNHLSNTSLTSAEPDPDLH